MEIKLKNSSNPDSIKKNQILIQRRKFELLKRDPAAKLMEGLISNRGVPQEISALLRDGGLEKKWNTSIWRDEGPSTSPFSGISIGSIPSPIRDGREDFSFKGKPVKDLGGHKFRWLMVPEGSIPILIDPNLLELNDEKKVKTHVWNIVEREISKRKKTQKPLKGWEPVAPEKETKEIAFIYRIKEKTFRNYLKWYDLKISGGLPFRLIAFYESRIIDPEKRDKAFEKETCRRKKTKLGTLIKGESKVRMGFNMIYRAIYRTPPPSKESELHRELNIELVEFNCPEHPGNSCPSKGRTWTCLHLDRYMQKVDSIYSEDPE